MAKNNANQPISVVITQGSLNASLPATGVFYLPRKARITGLHLIDQAGIPASNSNYITGALKSGSTTIASFDSRAANQGALTANVAKAASLVAADAVREAGETLTWECALTGTAVVTAGSLVLTYVPL